MKNIVLICAVLGLLGSIVKKILIVLKKETFSYLLDVLICIMTIFLFVNYIIGNKVFGVQTEIELNQDYESISSSEFVKIIEFSEEEISNILISKISNEFDVEVRECELNINSTDLEVDSAKIYINSNGKLLSGYEINEYIKTNFEINVEVIVF